MQGPTLDLVLLLLLVLFFGLQQRSRPQAYFGLWCGGWLFVFFSFAVWLVVPGGRVAEKLLDALRFDLLLVGTTLFLTSFLTDQKRLWKLMLWGMLIAVPTVLLFNAVQIVPVPRFLLMGMVAAWESYGIYAARQLLPRGRRWTRGLICGICGVSGVGAISYFALATPYQVVDWTLTEVMLCSAVLYTGISKRESVGKWIGVLGFVGWACFPLMGELLQHQPSKLAVVYQFWNVPKYLVAFSMIMHVFERETDEKSQLADEFKELYEDFRLMYQSHPLPMWICEPGTTTVLSANEAAEKKYGYTQEEWLKKRLRDMELPVEEDVAMLNELAAPVMEGRRTRHRYSNGTVAWVTLDESHLVFKGRPAQMVMARDVTERLRLNQQLAHQATHDVLTGLPNRALLEDRLRQCLDRCSREGRKAVLLTIDIDHFKRINDMHGHHVGDACLKSVAERLKNKIRQVDTIARTGGEEFTAIIGGLGSQGDAEKIVESLLRAFTDPILLPDCDMAVTVSIGGAMFPEDATDVERLRRLSDGALYRAKGDGRNCARFAGAAKSA